LLHIETHIFTIRGPCFAGRAFMFAVFAECKTAIWICITALGFYFDVIETFRVIVGYVVITHFYVPYDTCRGNEHRRPRVFHIEFHMKLVHVGEQSR